MSIKAPFLFEKTNDKANHKETRNSNLSKQTEIADCHMKKASNSLCSIDCMLSFQKYLPSGNLVIQMFDQGWI